VWDAVFYLLDVWIVNWPTVKFSGWPMGAS